MRILSGYEAHTKSCSHGSKIIWQVTCQIPGPMLLYKILKEQIDTIDSVSLKSIRLILFTSGRHSLPTTIVVDCNQ